MGPGLDRAYTVSSRPASQFKSRPLAGDNGPALEVSMDDPEQD